MRKEIAEQTLLKVKQDYELIAENFSQTRKYLWSDFEPFKTYIKTGMKVLDVGCGNGRLFELFKDKNVDYSGIDNCARLIQIAQAKYGPHFTEGDILALPFQQPEFDIAFMLAVLHHIPGEEYRLTVLKNINKTLKPGGYLMMTNWDLWQPKYQKYIVKNNLKKLMGFSHLDLNDCLIPWQGKVLRYCHAFTRHELRGLLHKSGFEIISQSFTGHNILTIAKKS